MEGRKYAVPIFQGKTIFLVLYLFTLDLTPKPYLSLGIFSRIKYNINPIIGTNHTIISQPNLLLTLNS